MLVFHNLIWIETVMRDSQKVHIPQRDDKS